MDADLIKRISVISCLSIRDGMSSMAISNRGFQANIIKWNSDIKSSGDFVLLSDDGNIYKCNLYEGISYP